MSEESQPVDTGESQPLDPESVLPVEDAAGLPVAPPSVRDPWKGLRGVMAATLCLEFVVFALALLVVAQLGRGVSSVGFAVVALLSLLMLVAAFVQRKPWGLWVAIALQVAMVACFFVNLAVGGMGVVFLAIWGYILYVRRDVAARMRAGQLADQLGHPPN